MDYQEYSLESEIQNDSDDNGSNEQLSYGLNAIESFTQGGSFALEDYLERQTCETKAGWR